MSKRKAEQAADTGQDTLATDSSAPPSLVSAHEAAAHLGVHERTIRRAVARGELTATKHGGILQIAPDELARYRMLMPEVTAPRLCRRQGIPTPKPVATTAS